MKKQSVNRFRKKINKKIEKPELRNITFRIPEEILEKFKKECETEGFKMNQVVLEMIKDYIK